MSIAQINHFPM